MSNYTDDPVSAVGASVYVYSGHYSTCFSDKRSESEESRDACECNFVMLLAALDFYTPSTTKLRTWVG